jgi:hypothetical protein
MSGWARKFRVAAAGLLGASAFFWASAAGAEVAVLQGLDKITARISTFEVEVNRSARFGSLEITVRRCHKTPPEEPPESTAFLEIVDVRPDSPAVPLFTGWMFASSPAVSALEHAVYDVWVVDCRDQLSPPPEEVQPEDPPADEEAPAEEGAATQP